MVIRKAVIAAAGLGTRLLPVSKELPKEMLPVFAKNISNKLVIKPLLQLVFEQLYHVGVKDFCFVVGRGKRAIEDHFTPDWRFVSELIDKGKDEYASDLDAFYRMIEGSTIVWINQPKPLGFGHAVYQARPFIEEESFLVAAGDTYIVSQNHEHIVRLLETFSKTDSAVSFLVKKVENPSLYGVVLTELLGDVFRVKGAVEKSADPPSDLAIMPFYAFKSDIMDALGEIKSDVGGEIQLTDGIQNLIERQLLVTAVPLNKEEVWLDIGTPESYWRALEESHNCCNRDIQ